MQRHGKEDVVWLVWNAIRDEAGEVLRTVLRSLNQAKYTYFLYRLCVCDMSKFLFYKNHFGSNGG